MSDSLSTGSADRRPGYDARPTTPEAPEPLIIAAMRAIPPLLAEIRFAYGVRRDDEGETVVLYNVLASTLKKMKHHYAAAQWGIHRLVQLGRLTALVSQSPSQTARNRFLEIRTTPSLWAWWRESFDEASTPKISTVPTVFNKAVDGSTPANTSSQRLPQPAACSASAVLPEPVDVRLGQLIAELQRHEADRDFNRARAEEHLANNDVAAHSFYWQLSRPWRPDPVRMPGIELFQAAVEALIGPLAYESVVRARGQICLGSRISIELVNAMTLVQASAALSTLISASDASVKFADLSLLEQQQSLVRTGLRRLSQLRAENYALSDAEVGSDGLLRPKTRPNEQPTAADVPAVGSTSIPIASTGLSKGELNSASPPAPKAAHSADFTMVDWFGNEHTFAIGIQSSAVKVLWQEWESSGLGLHQGTIGEAIDPERDNFRMDLAFRNHPAFGTMIQSCGDGRYKLVPPKEKPVEKKPQNAKRTPKSRQWRV